MSTNRTVRVALGDRGYDIQIGAGLLERAGELVAPLASTKRVFVVTDENVARFHLETLKRGLKSAGLVAEALVLPPGETTKNFDNLQLVLETLLDASAERNDLVIALGGGVIGDLTGLAAGLMKRGAKFVQIPTTLLAQVDSSVGGKTAINTSQGKNLVGMFYQPRLVIADLAVLETLPTRHKRAGYAEIVKYGLIDDEDFFDFLASKGHRILEGDLDGLAEAVERSCEAKARIVAQDEREAGVRALLNFGHTFGHALERANGYAESLFHGEAVGCGMAMATRYSQQCGLITRDDVARTEEVLGAGGLATDLASLDGGPYDASTLMTHMQQDKKVESGRLTLILTAGIGKAFIQKDNDINHVRAFLEVETSIR